MKWKIIRIYLVEANTRAEAIEKMAIKRKLGKEDEFFQTEIVKKQEEPAGGWKKTLMSQVLGKH